MPTLCLASRWALEIEDGIDTALTLAAGGQRMWKWTLIIWYLRERSDGESLGFGEPRGDTELSGEGGREGFLEVGTSS